MVLQWEENHISPQDNHSVISRQTTIKHCFIGLVASVRKILIINHQSQLIGVYNFISDVVPFIEQ